MPKFELVRNITECTREKYDAALVLFKNRSCEFSYSNLFAWQDEYNTKMCDAGDFFAVRFEIDGKDVYLPPVASGEFLKDFLELVKEESLKREKTKAYFCGFSQQEAEILSKFAANVSFYPDRNNFDYLYEIKPLVTFSGKKLHSKRNHLNRFMSGYKDRFCFEKMTQKTALDCIEFTHKWQKLNENFINDSLMAENKSAVVLLENFENLDLLGGVLYVDGSIVGYTVGKESFPFSDTLVVNIEKGHYDVPGVYPMLFSSFMSLFEDRFKYVNREDDLGDEGLRKSKMSYNPCMMLEKYSGEIEIK